MFSPLHQHRNALFLLTASLIFFVALVFMSDASYDNGDGIRHYVISRYSWNHPSLLLDSWGKPFFTLVASPFAQFGLKGISIFNILCGIVSSWCSFRIAQRLKLKLPVLAPVFLLFMPCYFPILNSGLTEAFFGLVLIASVLLLMEKKYLPAAVLVSFLPFVRTEGFLLLPLFAIVLAYRKQYLSIAMLATGTFLYSLIGFFHYGDFFWIKTQNPYDGTNRAFYGTGELMHFVKNYNFLFGTVLTGLLLIGCVALARNFFRITRQKQKNEAFAEESFLIYGAFAIYFVAHSIMWWKGMANSLGLLRVIAGVAPCAALICLRGLDLLIIPWLEEKKILLGVFITAALAMIIRSPFKHEYFPFRLNPQEELVQVAADWYNSSAFAGKKVYYLHPYFTHVLDVDPYDPEKAGELWGLYPMMQTYGEETVGDSSIVFWDAHFGPNECRIPLDSIMSDTRFELVKTFRPAEQFTSLGGYTFEIHAFMKVTR